MKHFFFFFELDSSQIITVRVNLEPGDGLKTTSRFWPSARIKFQMFWDVHNIWNAKKPLKKKAERAPAVWLNVPGVHQERKLKREHFYCIRRGACSAAVCWPGASSPKPNSKCNLSVVCGGDAFLARRGQQPQAVNKLKWSAPTVKHISSSSSPHASPRQMKQWRLVGFSAGL